MVLPLPVARAVMVGSGGGGKFCNAMFYMNEHSCCKQGLLISDTRIASRAATKVFVVAFRWERRASALR
jgi:hypothetical protein